MSDSDKRRMWELQDLPRLTASQRIELDRLESIWESSQVSRREFPLFT